MPSAVLPTPSPRPRRRGARAALLPTVAVAAASLAVAGCGGDDAATTNAAAATTGTVPRSALADDVPARTAAFAEAAVRPTGDARRAIDQVIGLVGGGDRYGALSKRLRLGDDLLPQGRTLKKDVLPHLGDHVAAFLLGGDAPKDGARTAAKDADGAIVAEVRDAAALREAVGTRGKAATVGGQTIRVRGDHAIWIGDRVAAVGSEPAVRAAVEAAGGADLTGNARFTGALEQVRATSPVGLAWVDLQQAPALNAAFRTVASRADRPASSPSARSKALRSVPKELRDRLEDRLGATAGRRSGSARGFDVTLPATDATAAMALELSPGRLVVRSGGTGAKPVQDPKPATDAVAGLPAGSWAGFAGTASGALDAGSPGAQAFDRLTSMLGTKLPAGLREALSSVEVVSGGVQGQNLLAATGGLVVRAKDDAGAAALLKQVESAVSATGSGSKGRSRGPFGLGGLTAKPATIPGASSGLTVGLPGLPLQLAAGVQGDRLAIGLGVDSVTKALKSDGDRFSSDPLYSEARKALDGVAPSLVVRPKPLSDLLSSLGGGLGGLLGSLGGGSTGGGGAGGAGGLGGLLGGGSSGKGGAAGPLGSGGLTRVFDAIGRVELVTAGREKTGEKTWRGTLVVDYDATTPKAKPRP